MTPPPWGTNRSPRMTIRKIVSESKLTKLQSPTFLEWGFLTQLRESKTGKILKSHIELLFRSLKLTLIGSVGVCGGGGAGGSLPTESFVIDLLHTDLVRSTTIWWGTIN